jgi:hypothetical protein
LTWEGEEIWNRSWTILVGEEPEHRRTRGFDEAQRLAEGQLLVLGEHLSRDVHQQPHAPNAVLFLVQGGLVRHPSFSTEYRLVTFPAGPSRPERLIPGTVARAARG